jgi:hypothetical protein
MQYGHISQPTPPVKSCVQKWKTTITMLTGTSRKKANVKAKLPYECTLEGSIEISNAEVCGDPEFITNSKCPLCNPSQSQNHCCDLHNVVDIIVP